MAGDSVRESAAATNSVLRDAVDGELISIEALEGSAPAQAAVAESTAPLVSIDPGTEPDTVVFYEKYEKLLDGVLNSPEPDPHVSPGEKITRVFAERFVNAYGEIIRERAEAVAERASPFAIADSIKINYFATVEGLMRWGRGSAYHRGLTEEYFTVAAVTYQKLDGSQVSIPIQFDWNTHQVTPWFIASKVGQ